MTVVGTHSYFTQRIKNTHAVFNLNARCYITRDFYLGLSPPFGYDILINQTLSPTFDTTSSDSPLVRVITALAWHLLNCHLHLKADHLINTANDVIAGITLGNIETIGVESVFGASDGSSAIISVFIKWSAFR